MLRQPAVALSLAALLTPAPSRAQPTDALIRNAMSAAPASVASRATIMDGKHRVLRSGDNGWICLPDDPTIPNNSPMCLDAQWLDFIDALMDKRPPAVVRLGVGYMLQDDMPVSNVDPFAPSPTATNQWVANSGSHVMLIVPDTKALDGIPTDPGNGGPWVMWRGTPYAHVMVPMGRASMHSAKPGNDSTWGSAATMSTRSMISSSPPSRR